MTPAADATTILQALLDYYEKEPGVLLLTTTVTAVLAGAFLIAVVRAINKAGNMQPPRQVLALLVSLIGLIALLGVILRPDVQALAVAAGTAIGALAGALATAYSPSGIKVASEPEPGVETPTDPPAAAPEGGEGER